MKGEAWIKQRQIENMSRQVLCHRLNIDRFTIVECQPSRIPSLSNSCTLVSSASVDSLPILPSDSHGQNNRPVVDSGRFPTKATSCNASSSHRVRLQPLQQPHRHRQTHPPPPHCGKPLVPRHLAASACARMPRFKDCSGPEAATSQPSSRLLLPGLAQRPQLLSHLPHHLQPHLPPHLPPQPLFPPPHRHFLHGSNNGRLRRVALPRRKTAGEWQRNVSAQHSKTTATISSLII